MKVSSGLYQVIIFSELFGLFYELQEPLANCFDVVVQFRHSGENLLFRDRDSQYFCSDIEVNENFETDIVLDLNSDPGTLKL